MNKQLNRNFKRKKQQFIFHNKIIYLIFIIFLSSTGSLFSQPDYKTLQQQSSVNYFDIVEDFESWLDTVVIDSTVEKEIIRFDRWKHFWEPRITTLSDPSSNGSFANYAQVMAYYWQDFYPCTGIDEADFEKLGPFPNNLHDMGFIQAVWTDPGDLDFILVGNGRRAGILRTEDGGENWEDVLYDSHIPGCGITSFAVSPTDYNGSRVIYASTGYDYNLGILKSYDNGDTWHILENFPTLNNNEYYKKVIKVIIPNTQNIIHDPSLSNQQEIVYAIVGTQLLKSTDGGDTWSVFKDFTGSGNLNDIEINSSDNDIIAVSTSGYTPQGGPFVRAEVWLSSDGGATWGEILQFSGYSNLYKLGNTLIDMPDADFLYVHSITNDGYLGERKIMYTNNWGSTWAINYHPPDFQFNRAFEVSEDRSNIYTAGMSFYINNVSQTPYAATSYSHCDWRSLQVFGDVIIAGNDGGVTRSTDMGATYESLNWDPVNGSPPNGLVNNEVIGFNITDDDPGRIIAGLFDNYTKAYADNEWKYVTSCCDGGECFFIPGDPDKAVAIMNGSLALYQYTNGNWNYVPSNVNDPYSGIWIHRPARVSPHTGQYSDDFYYGLKGASISTTKNGGTTWSKITMPILNPDHRADIIDIEVAPTDPQIVYAVTRQALCGVTTQTKYSVFMSTDGGLTYSNISGGNGPSPIDNLWNYVTDLTVSAENPYEVWIGMSGTEFVYSTPRVYHCSNTNTTQNNCIWEDMTTSILPMLPVTAIEYQPGTGNRVFIATDGGIFYWSEADQDWICFNTGRPIVYVDDMKFSKATSELYISTWGGGILKSPVPCETELPSSHLIDSYTGNVTWSTNQIINGDIYVTSGYQLKIDNGATLFMSPSSTIYVDKNARLIVDNATITSTCDEYWDGIQVWGDRDLSQLPISNQGYVELKNGATIRRANNAIQAIEVDYNGNYVWNKTGGIIRAQDSRFINCVRGIWIGPYWNNQQGNVPSNRGYINNCEFLTDDNYKGYRPPVYHIGLYMIDNIYLNGNKFINTNTSLDQDIPSSRGIGVITYDATFTMQPYCTSITYPCASYEYPYFEGLNYGVRAINSGSAHPVTIHDCDFEDVYRGVFISGTSRAKVTLNTFNVPNKRTDYVPDDETYLIDHDPKAPYGIFIDGNTEFFVEENELNTISSLGKAESTYGILAHDCGLNTNDIYKNTITDFTYAIVPIGENHNAIQPITGLKILCNPMDENVMDVYVAANPNYAGDGISVVQGANDPLLIAGNSFTPIYGITENQHDKTDGDLFTYYYDGATQNQIPTDFDNVNPVDVSGVQSNLVCLSRIPSPGSTSLSSLYSSLSSNKAALNSAELIRSIWIDGGQPNLEQTVELTAPWEAYDQFNQLMLESPYLSEDVIIAAIENPVFTSMMIKLICIANPHSSRSQEIIDALYTRNPAMPESYINEILAEESTVSQLDHLNADVSMCFADFRNQISRIINFYDTDTTTIDTTSTYPRDSIINLLSRQTDLWSKYELAEQYYRFGQYSQMSSELSNIPSDFDLSDEQLLHHQDHVSLYGIKQFMSENNLYASELSSEQVNSLTTIADNNYPIVSARARALLFMNSEEFTYNEPIPIHNEPSQRIMPDEESKHTRSMKIFPNPTNDILNIEFENIPISNNDLVVVQDIIGKVVMERALSENEKSLILSLKDIKPGSYIVVLYKGNRIEQSEELIISR